MRREKKDWKEGKKMTTGRKRREKGVQGLNGMRNIVGDVMKEEENM